MTGVFEFEEFAGWVAAFASHEGFRERERDYKIELASDFGHLSSTGFDSGRLLQRLTDPANNIVTWTVPDAVRKSGPDELGSQTQLLLSDGDLAERLDRFGDWPQDTIDEPAGAQTTLASVLLMGSDVRVHAWIG